jgi:hypothetical protein
MRMLGAKRMIAAIGVALVGAAVAAAVSCEVRLDSELKGPATFEVTLREGETGSAEQPLAFSSQPLTYLLDVRAVDGDGSTADWFSGEVHLDLQPRGKLSSGQTRWLEVSEGIAEGVEVSVEKIHSTASIWVEDTGSEERPGGYATGLSPTLHFRHPTIRNAQESGMHLGSGLRGEFAEIDLEGRTAVVTGVSRDGFYVTDTSEPDLFYSSVYVYSFSRPDVEIGDRIAELRGTVDEFFGFTELGFPSWKAQGTADLPDAVRIDAQLLADDDSMEPYESALVEVTNVEVCPVAEGYHTYGQWKVLVDPAGDCSSGEGAINVVSAYTAPEIDPAELSGETIERIAGNLRYHMAASPSWIVYVRGSQDIDIGGEGR